MPARPPTSLAPVARHPCLQAAQFTQSRRDELLELQRSLLGFDDIALHEGLSPSETEIEVGGVCGGIARCTPVWRPIPPSPATSPCPRPPALSAPHQGEFKVAVAQFGQYGQEYDATRLREQVYESVKARKVMDWLTHNCKVNLLPPADAK